MGALEEAAKATGGFIETMRSQPLVLMMGLMNIGLLLFLFYYLSRITARTENTVKDLFAAQDRLFTQWGVIIKDTNQLTEKTMHCILPEDAIKLLQLPPRPFVPEPLQRPERPAPLEAPAPRGDSGGQTITTVENAPRPREVVDPPKPAPVPDPPKPQPEPQPGFPLACTPEKPC